PLNDRAWAYIGLGVNAKDRDGTRAALSLTRTAEDFAPWQSLPPLNAGFDEFELGHPELARAEFRRAQRTDDARGGVRPEMVKAFRMRLEGGLALLAGDYAGGERAWTQAMTFGRQGLNQSLA